MPESSNKLLIISIYSVLSLSILLVFWQVRNFDFVNYDDNKYVYENPHVLHGLTYDGLVSAFTSAPAGGNWLPLTWLSFMLDCQLFAASPGPLHLVNVFLHLINTLLLFAILKKMTGSLWPSAFVAAAFAIHPMHIESVAWVTERKDVLSGFFFLLTLVAYDRYVRGPSIYRYLLTLVLFELGLLAKPMLVTLPFVLVLLDYWPLNRFETQAVRTYGRQSNKSAPIINKRTVLKLLIIEKVPFLALSAISSVITFLVQQGSGAVTDINNLPLSGRFANSLLSYTRYINKMFWPQNLAVFYPFDIGTFTITQISLCGLLLLAISVFVIGFGRKQKYLLVGWFWFIATLIPVIGLVQSGEQSYADRYTYIPYIGLFIMIAWGLQDFLAKLPSARIPAVIFATVILFSFSIFSYKQTGYWKNSITLFSHTVEITQNNCTAQNNLAQALLNNGQTSLAIEHFEKALQIKPDSAYVHVNLGAALHREGKFDEAIAHYNKALQLMPDLAQARYNLAASLISEGKLDEALAQLRIAARLKPDWPAPIKGIESLIAAHPELKNNDANTNQLAH